jgi:hypothetical protein
MRDLITNMLSGMAGCVCFIRAFPAYYQVGYLLQSFPMSDPNLSPTAADATLNEIPIPIDAVASPASKPEFVSETLYIQNLNEKIRIDGSSPVPVTERMLTGIPSPQGIFTRSFQVVWRGT